MKTPPVLHDPQPRGTGFQTCCIADFQIGCPPDREHSQFLPIHRSIYPFLLLSLLISLSGCVSKTTADAQAKAAFLAGEKAAYETIQASQTSIVILGEVQKHQIPWAAGLTLSQAIAAAGYNGAHDPTDIILKRNSVQTEVDPKQLLNGQDVPLHPGDVISILSQ